METTRKGAALNFGEEKPDSEYISILDTTKMISPDFIHYDLPLLGISVAVRG